MPYTPASSVPLATLSEVKNAVITALGVVDITDVTRTQVAPLAPYTNDEIASKILDADYEVAMLIADSRDNPFKNLYFDSTNTNNFTDWLTNKKEVPYRVAEWSFAEMKEVVGDVDNKRYAGRQSKNLWEIERVNKQFVMFGSPKDLYRIHDGRVFLGKEDAVIRFLMPSVTRGTSALISPNAYKWAIVALAITKCYVTGTNAQHREYWTNIWREYEAKIKGRVLDLPEPEHLKRIGA